MVETKNLINLKYHSKKSQHDENQSSFTKEAEVFSGT